MCSAHTFLKVLLCSLDVTKIITLLVPGPSLIFHHHKKLLLKVSIMKWTCIVFNVTFCHVEYIPVNQSRFFPEARVVMTAIQEEITETIMTTEMGHAHIM